MASDNGVPILDNQAAIKMMQDSMKGGPFYQGAVPYPKLTFQDGYGKETMQMLQSGDMVNGMTIDAPWFSRRGNT